MKDLKRSFPDVNNQILPKSIVDKDRLNGSTKHHLFDLLNDAFIKVYQEIQQCFACKGKGATCPEVCDMVDENTMDNLLSEVGAGIIYYHI